MSTAPTSMLQWVFVKACKFEGWVPALAAKQRTRPWRKNNPWAARFEQRKAHHLAERSGTRPGLIRPLFRTPPRR